MQPVRIRLYYDFASTLCYVSHRVMMDIVDEIENLGVELEWRPIDLTETVPWDRGDSFTDEVREAVHNTASELGLNVTMPDPWLDSRPVSEIALGTTSIHNETRWRCAVFDSIFEQRERDLTNELLTLGHELATSEAVDAAVAATYTRVEDSTREANALGVMGVPTLLLDNWLFGGVYEPKAMIAIIDQLAEKYRELGDSIVN